MKRNYRKLTGKQLRRLYYTKINNYKKRQEEINKQLEIVDRRKNYIEKKAIEYFIKDEIENENDLYIEKKIRTYDKFSKKTDVSVIEYYLKYTYAFKERNFKYILLSVSISKIILLLRYENFTTTSFFKNYNKVEIFIFITNLFTLRSLQYFLELLEKNDLSYLYFINSIYKTFYNEKNRKTIKNIKENEYLLKKILNNKKALNILIKVIKANNKKNNLLYAFLVLAREKLKIK